MSTGAAELLAVILSAVIVAEVALAIAIARALQRLARLEERTDRSGFFQVSSASSPGLRRDQGGREE